MIYCQRTKHLRLKTKTSRRITNYCSKKLTICFRKCKHFLTKLLWIAKRWRYHRYLRGRRWAKKRHAVLVRDGFECTRCGGDLALQVHHLTYERIFRERMGDLVTLCVGCHMEEHQVQQMERDAKRAAAMDKLIAR